MLIPTLGPDSAGFVLACADGHGNTGKPTTSYRCKVPGQLQVEIREHVSRNHMRDHAGVVIHNIFILNVHERDALNARLNHCFEKSKVTHQHTTLATIKWCRTLRYERVNAK
ncbi:MAG: hypothetical protein AAFP17_07510 [Pseudomonadota bacterium]